MLGQEAGLASTVSFCELGEKRQEPPRATMPWAGARKGQLPGGSEQAGTPSAGARAVLPGPRGGGGGQGLGKGGLWIIGCSMKIKELCQRLLFLLASP